MPELLEALMVISFGLSWPANILKLYRSRTTKGVSIFFYTCIFLGYLCGIAAKHMLGSLTYVLFFYYLNAAMVLTGIVFYFRNARLDKEAEAAGASEVSQKK